ncbi:DinB family protein [Chitinophaga solisilvae]|uniref:DinB family protein n=1 Tax=Chitinophaga solisilvae TaxID=1233460 RepID=UPI00136CCD48|nr:DinB family protein [Chitinophaga solisilvae]
MKPHIAEELKQTRQELLNVLSSLSEEQLNTVPFAGSWTAAQVADHVYKGAGTDNLFGNTAAADRAPDEKVSFVRDFFLNFQVKFSSPEFILPTDEHQPKAIVLEHIAGAWDRLYEIATTEDLDLICLDFVLPDFGPLTRLEWLHFINVHAQRHLRQLQHISEKVTVMA